ncbi:MAG: ribonuclease H-like domain-containing protein [Candidatus Neomarinimicrobiota bacterium]
MTGSTTIKNTLRRLYSQDSAAKHFPDESVTRARRAIHEFVDGEYVNTPFGDIFVSQVRHPRDYCHGRISLRTVTQISDDWLSRWGKFSSHRKFDFGKTIFVDTETSGIAGGGGTLPFLIGIGYYYRGQFRVEQFFADSHSREEGMLDLVAQFVRPFNTLVTFNGKAFDIPLLETRYLLKRKENPFSRMEHLDLLHPSRQLWNLTLDNCRLQTIEYRLLGFHRDDDLPGEEIPQAYFDYVRWGKADPLYRVFRHNADDITSLSAVMYLLWRAVQEDDSHRDAMVEFSRGKILKRHGETERAVRSLEAARRREASPRKRTIILSHLSMMYKSLGKWRKAEALWREMIDSSTAFHLLPYVELAKYYEHGTKNLTGARELVEEALSRIPRYRQSDVEALIHRLNRLKRRIGKMESRAV